VEHVWAGWIRLVLWCIRSRRCTHNTACAILYHMTYHFVIPMRCATKARPRVSKRGTYMPEAYVTWKAEFAVHCMAHGHLEPLQGPVSLTVAVELKGCARGDADNYAGAVMDALEGLCYANDKQINVLIVMVLEHAAADTVIVDVSSASHNNIRPSLGKRMNPRRKAVTSE